MLVLERSFLDELFTLGSWIYDICLGCPISTLSTISKDLKDTFIDMYDAFVESIHQIF